MLCSIPCVMLLLAGYTSQEGARRSLLEVSGCVVLYSYLCEEMDVYCSVCRCRGCERGFFVMTKQCRTVL
jgi:hypothetical protein